MHRALILSLAIVTAPGIALASINPEPLENDAPILTPVQSDRIEIKVAAEEINACRELLSAVLGEPPMTVATAMGAEPAPSLPVVQCVVEARAD
ncbi:hypothetical protein [Pseudooceanicola sp. MF1-13]|uniref:hypothetical protein n=1 Tax=Pseudooceanicola sp. MF1-13 TaxID=3379095 RepID=UPI0038919F87